MDQQLLPFTSISMASGKIQCYRLREQLSKQAERDLEGKASDGTSQS